jgi:hypothetical protein
VSRDWALARAWLNRALNQDKRIGADGVALGRTTGIA